MKDTGKPQRVTTQRLEILNPKNGFQQIYDRSLLIQLVTWLTCIYTMIL